MRAVAGEILGVTKVSTSDLTAFAEVFEAQRPSALRLTFAMMGDAAAAEDVVAEAFARTYERWVKGEIANPDAYVRAVVNEVRSTWRRLAVRRKAHGPRTPRRIVDGSSNR